MTTPVPGCRQPVQVAQIWVFRFSRHRSWESYKTLLKMFKYQNTEMGVEPSSILESRCSALSSQCQVPECLRFQMFPTWQISRTRLKHGKSIVNPQIHASCDVASNIIQHCLFLGFIWETMLLAGEAGVHSVNRHAKCFPVTQDNYTKTPRTKKFLRTMRTHRHLGFLSPW